MSQELANLRDECKRLANEATIAMYQRDLLLADPESNPAIVAELAEDIERMQVRIAELNQQLESQP